MKIIKLLCTVLLVTYLLPYSNITLAGEAYSGAPANQASSFHQNITSLEAKIEFYKASHNEVLQKIIEGLKKIKIESLSVNEQEKINDEMTAFRNDFDYRTRRAVLTSGKWGSWKLLLESSFLN